MFLSPKDLKTHLKVMTDRWRYGKSVKLPKIVLTNLSKNAIKPYLINELLIYFIRLS